MLVVLSEMNCLKNLNALGVFPDVFYTDYNLFKNHAVSYNDADIIIMFIGNCKFNRKLVIETVKNLMKRADNDKDKGVRSVTVLSDGQHPGLKGYYRFINDITRAIRCDSYTEVKGSHLENIWQRFKSAPKEARVFLDDYDTNDSSKARKAYEERSNSDDAYVSLIKTVNVKAMLA